MCESLFGIIDPYSGLLAGCLASLTLLSLAPELAYPCGRPDTGVSCDAPGVNSSYMASDITVTKKRGMTYNLDY